MKLIHRAYLILIVCILPFAPSKEHAQSLHLPIKTDSITQRATSHQQFHQHVDSQFKSLTSLVRTNYQKLDSHYKVDAENASRQQQVLVMLKIVNRKVDSIQRENSKLNTKLKNAKIANEVDHEEYEWMINQHFIFRVIVIGMIGFILVLTILIRILHYVKQPKILSNVQ